MSQKIGEKSFTKQIENFSESIDISKKTSPKLMKIHSLKMTPQKLVKNHSPKK